MKTATQSPLKALREGICPSRADFCRRHGLGYQSTTLAEVGLVPNPANFVRVLAAITHRSEAELLAEHKAWLATGLAEK